MFSKKIIRTAAIGDNELCIRVPSGTGHGPGKSGKQQHGPTGVVGKKKGPKSATSNVVPEEKDPDGSIRVPGYRGVWVNQAGKHFVKIKGKRLTKDDDDDDDVDDTTTKDGTTTTTNNTLYFDTIDEAARKHDTVLKGKNPGPTAEYNFKADGSRIVYEDVSTSSTTGLGGSASSVVPALSVINIKVRSAWMYYFMYYIRSIVLTERNNTI